MLSLVPRLNYKYTLKDALISFKGIFKKEISIKPLTNIFQNEDIFFVNHARTGIRIALDSLNLQPSSRIGVQAFNCHTVFNAIKQAGYKHEFIDITDDFQLDINDLKNKKDRINALIVTHLFGIPAEMDKIKSILPHIPIIEDCAQSFLSKHKGQLTGTIGDIGVFSIGKAKFPSIGQGGYIVVNNKIYNKTIIHQTKKLKKNSLFKEIKSITYSLTLNFLHKPIIYWIFTYPVLKRIDKKHDLCGKYEFEEKEILKSNKNLLIQKIDKLKVQKQIQKNNAHNIIHGFSKMGNVKQINKDCNWDLNYFMVPVLVKKNRDNLIKYFHKNGLEIGRHFSQSITWAKSYGYGEGDCEHSEKTVEQLITLPTYKNLPKKYSKKVIKILENYACFN